MSRFVNHQGSSCLVAHEASVRTFHALLSCAIFCAVFHVSDTVPNSSSIMRLHVVFGLPFFLFPSGVQVRAVFAGILEFILVTCPSHFHLLFFRMSSMVSWLVSWRSLVLDILLGHQILWSLRRIQRIYCTRLKKIR